MKPANFPDVEFTVLGVSKQIGVFVNEKLKGNEIKQSYFRVYRNQFCYNPYRINVGSIGFCELEIENQIISGAYNIFGCNEDKLNPKYLDALFKTKMFLDYVNEKAIGGVRMDFKIENMQEWQIPLPPLEIQNEIVEKVEKQKQIIEGAEKIIDKYELQITNASGWIEKPISDLLVESLYGSSEKADYQKEGYNILRINNVGFCDFDLSDIKKVVLSKKKFAKYELKKGDFLIVRSNGNPNLVGKCAVWNLDTPFVYASYLIRFRFKTNEVEPKYVMYYLMSPQGRNLLNPTAGGGTYNISATDFQKIPISFPNVEIQHQIIYKLDKQMQALESVRYLKAEAEKRIEEILSGVWGEKAVETIPAITPNEDVVEEKAPLKRRVLATYIINQSLNDPHFGNVKFEKLLYLSECFAIKRNFEQKYYQQAAGPYDNVFTISYFNQIEKSKWFKKQQKGNQFAFIAGEKHDKSLNMYGCFSDSELERVNTLIAYFKKSDYEQPEIIATLYAVWNNRIIKQEPITDELLKEDFLNWDSQKIKYKDRLDKALQWMKDNNIVPDGWGKVIEKAEKKKK
ncbi:MAG: restriction endonuclease subunit S [Prevotellaceae bacterium]|jgi:restriction endonuclease S subunit|nr:restriction endonuclease subunit S [Prevotellaceae bacterium]